MRHEIPHRLRSSASSKSSNALGNTHGAKRAHSKRETSGKPVTGSMRHAAFRARMVLTSIRMHVSGRAWASAYHNPIYRGLSDV